MKINRIYRKKTRIKVEKKGESWKDEQKKKR